MGVAVNVGVKVGAGVSVAVVDGVGVKVSAIETRNASAVAAASCARDSPLDRPS